ncbi:excalibur calcium-binding domain-containing protein [Mesorhizobium sp. M0643]|uniref:excalibur calcium-binding domain-containing protein n=1 Tax=Mesorhizobium sp. M0643 TaxID=2956978 RepID=UPI003334FA76
MSSCDEASWYLANCSWGRKLDRDKDGIACESQCRTCRCCRFTVAAARGVGLVMWRGS